VDAVRLVGGLVVLALNVPGAVRPRARAVPTSRPDVVLGRPGATRFLLALVSALGAYLVVTAFADPHDSWLPLGAAIVLIPPAAVSLVLARLQGVPWAFADEDRPPEYAYGPPEDPAGDREDRVTGG
jgi:hypothetical protein